MRGALDPTYWPISRAKHCCSDRTFYPLSMPSPYVGGPQTSCHKGRPFATTDAPCIGIQHIDIPVCEPYAALCSRKYAMTFRVHHADRLQLTTSRDRRISRAWCCFPGAAIVKPPHHARLGMGHDPVCTLKRNSSKAATRRAGLRCWDLISPSWGTTTHHDGFTPAMPA